MTSNEILTQVISEINQAWWQHFRMMWLAIAFDYRDNYKW